MAMFKCKGQVLFRGLKVVIKHVLPADVILVGDLLGLGISFLEWRALDGPDERLAEMQLVDPEIDLEELVDDV